MAYKGQRKRNDWPTSGKPTLNNLGFAQSPHMKLCIIGCGNMGSALAEGLAKGGAIRPSDMLLFDRTAGKARTLARRIGAEASANARQAVRQSDIAIMAVKPFAVEELLSGIGDELGGKLLLSVAAGITSSFIEKRTPASCRVAVAMPNLAMRVGKGASVYFAGKRTGAKDAKTLGKLLSSAGLAIRARRERDLLAAYIASSG